MIFQSPVGFVNGNFANANIQNPGLPDRTPHSPSRASPAEQQPFCYTFDLRKRFQPPTGSAPPTYIHPLHSSTSSQSPFVPILTTLATHLTTSHATPTRLIIPTLLNPLFYPVSASSPQHFIPFLHTLRSLLRQHSRTLTIAMSYPLTLYPRASSPLTQSKGIKKNNSWVDDIATRRPGFSSLL